MKTVKQIRERGLPLIPRSTYKVKATFIFKGKGKAKPELLSGDEVLYDLDDLTDDEAKPEGGQDAG